MSNRIKLPPAEAAHREWVFLTSHALVLVCIAADPDIRMRDIAARVGITERAVQKIVQDLVSAGYLAVARQHRRNRYKLAARRPLRHALEAHRTAGHFIEFWLPKT